MTPFSLALTIIWIASLNALFFFCLFHKWNRKLKDKVCVFCTIGWTAIIEGVFVVLFVYFAQNLHYLALLSYIPHIASIWCMSVINYTFLMMAFEHRQ